MKVLLGIGGGDDSRRALEQTVTRAAEAGDDLTVAVVDAHGWDIRVTDSDQGGARFGITGVAEVD